MKKKILIVVANYYKVISSGLLKSAQKEISRSYDIKIINVPGAFEIPVSISRNINKFHAFIALGCVIKGKTPHFDFISKTTFEGLMKLSIDNKKPIGNAVLTCLNNKQVDERIIKGDEATKAVLNVLKPNKYF